MPENNVPEFRYMNEWVNQNRKMKINDCPVIFMTSY